MLLLCRYSGRPSTAPNIPQVVAANRANRRSGLGATISEVMFCLQQQISAARTYILYSIKICMVSRWRVCRPDVKMLKTRTIYYYNIIKHIRAPDPRPLRDRKFGGAAAELYNMRDSMYNHTRWTLHIHNINPPDHTATSYYYYYIKHTLNGRRYKCYTSL